MIKRNRAVQESLNDGLLRYGKKITLRDEKKKIIGTEFKEEGRLFYALKNINVGDYAERFGISKKVDLKIKTYNCKNLTESHLIILNGSVYEIISKDIDFEKTHVYLYLQKQEDK